MGELRQTAALVVLDSVGIGELPDADDYGDVGADTLGNITRTIDGFELPNLVEFGLGNIEGVDDLGKTAEPRASFGRMREISHGKDTTTGHWEFAGVVLDEPFQTFPDGFGDEIIDAFIEETGCGGVLGNKPESGTVIIEELGKEHEKKGWPIVYTSADPVFQIAAHEDVVPVERLYEWCKEAYDIVIPEGISRVIARPFVGEWPDYTRTSRRKDFAFPPPKKTVCEAIQEAGYEVTGVGKIGHIYSHRGMSTEIPTENNDDGIDVTIERIENRDDFVFTNLVDFDSKFGHRRDPEGYAQALRRFDDRLSEIVDALEPGDLLILTADHGNDPTFRGTDHTREYVPLLSYRKGEPNGVELGTRSSFCDVGATVADYFDLDWEHGESFLSE